MAVTYDASVKTARMQAVADQIDVGTGAGKLKIRDASNNILASFTLTDPCGSVSGSVLTLDFDPDISATASATGTAANAIITDSADNTKVSGLTVGISGSGSDVILASTSITSGQTVTIQTGTLTHA